MGISQDYAVCTLNRWCMWNPNGCFPWEKPLWEDRQDQWVSAGFSRFWHLGCHALFWLDLYLSGSGEDFTPPAPFDLTEMEAGDFPPRTYSREELLSCLDHCRKKGEAIMGQQAGSAPRWVFRAA